MRMIRICISLSKRESFSFVFRLLNANDSYFHLTAGAGPCACANPTCAYPMGYVRPSVRGIVQILQLCESDGNFWYCANPTPIAGKSGAKPPALREQIKLYVLLLELVNKKQLKN